MVQIVYFLITGNLLPHITLSFDFTNVMLLSAFDDSNACFALVSLRFATKLLQLAHFEALELNFDYDNFNARLRNIVLEVARVLRSKNFGRDKSTLGVGF